MSDHIVWIDSVPWFSHTDSRVAPYLCVRGEPMTDAPTARNSFLDAAPVCERAPGRRVSREERMMAHV